MTPQDAIRFENYARSCGYTTNKEGGRYCQGIVNQLKDAWCAAQKETAVNIAKNIKGVKAVSADGLKTE